MLEPDWRCYCPFRPLSLFRFRPNESSFTISSPATSTAALVNFGYNPPALSIAVYAPLAQPNGAVYDGAVTGIHHLDMDIDAIGIERDYLSYIFTDRVEYIYYYAAL